MPLLILIVTTVAGVVWWWARSNPREAIDVAQDVATTVRNAPRKLAFRSQTREHPVEGIDDYRIAVGALGLAFIEVDGLPTQEERTRLVILLRSRLKCSEEEAEEIATLSRWLIDQCKGAQPAVSRIGRRLFKIDGNASLGDLEGIMSDPCGAQPSERQQEVLTDIRRMLRK